jgi:hypothetical protein
MHLVLKYEGKMTSRIIRLKLTEEVFRKYKVYCAMSDVSMTDQTNRIVKKFVDEVQDQVKIINLKGK